MSTYFSMPSSLHKKNFLETIKLQTKLGMKLLFSANPLLPFTVILLVIGVSAGLVLTENSTDLRQQAQVIPYTTCIDGSTPVLSGVDVGGCRCPAGNVVNPEAHCNNPTNIISIPTNTPYCVQDAEVVGYGGVCCSGHSYQSGNDIICGVLIGPTCLGSCVGKSGNSCEAIGRYSEPGWCVGDGLCCGTSLAFSPTPTIAGVGGPVECSRPNYCFSAERCSSLGTPLTGDCPFVGDVCCKINMSPTPIPSLSNYGETCQSDNNCQKGLVCHSGVCGCAANTCTGTNIWCGADYKYTTLTCPTGLKSCDSWNNGACAQFTPTPFPTRTPMPTSKPICVTSTYRCESNIEHYCFGGGETSTACGYGGCDASGYKCKDSSCSGTNGTIVGSNPITFCCNGQISAKSCPPELLASFDEACQGTNNCQKGLICDAGKCVECNADSCVNGKWCGHDGHFSYSVQTQSFLTCQFGQTRCDSYGTGVCKAFTPTPTSTPTPDPNKNCRQNSDCRSGYICRRDLGDNTFSCQPLPTNSPNPTITPININCRQNSDCKFGYICLRDGDNTFSCQPEQKTKKCWTLNTSNRACEMFTSYSGISCPTGSSPNVDVCANPTPQVLLDSAEKCAIKNDSYCLGNNKVTCDAQGNTSVEACPGGCNVRTCLPPYTGACGIGLQWCAGNTHYTCVSTQGNSDAAMAGKITQESCDYGCDYATNNCYQDPSKLSYIATLEQSIENKYGITISVELSSSEEKERLLLAIENVYSTTPASFHDSVVHFDIDTYYRNAPGVGWTYMNGAVSLALCYGPGDEGCQFVVLHEIGHNTENTIVNSTYCPSGTSCLGIEGFVKAAEIDKNPVFFNSNGHLNTTTSNVAGLGDAGMEVTDETTLHGDHATLTEFYANYQAVYFQDGPLFREKHPEIYGFFQDMYHEYPQTLEDYTRNYFNTLP